MFWELNHQIIEFIKNKKLERSSTADISNSVLLDLADIWINISSRKDDTVSNVTNIMFGTPPIHKIYNDSKVNFELIENITKIIVSEEKCSANGLYRLYTASPNPLNTLKYDINKPVFH